MPIRKSLGIFFNRPGFYSSGDLRSRIAAFKEPHIHGKFGHEPLGLYKRTLGPPSVFEPLPIYPGFADIGATIAVESLPFEDLRASIAAWYVANTKDLGSQISPTIRLSSDLPGIIKGFRSGHTDVHEYITTVISFFGGFSVFRRLRTPCPDLYASIRGFNFLGLSASILIRQRAYSDLGGIITVTAPENVSLYAFLQPLHINDFPALLNVVDPADLISYITTIPPKPLPASLTPIPPSDLSVFIGAHPPVDLSGYLLVNPPVDLSAIIWRGYDGTSSLSAYLNVSSAYSTLTGRITVFRSATEELPASIKPWGMGTLTANISGWGVSSLTANIYALYSRDIIAKIFGYAVEASVDLSSVIWPTRQLTSNLTASVSGWLSAHTSDRPISYGKLPVKASTILLSAFGGFSVFWPDTVYGYTPDLHASIVARHRPLSDLGCYIIPTIRLTSDLSSTIYSKTKLVVMNTLDLRFVNSASLSAYVGIFSGYRTLSVYIRGYAHGATSTSSGAYWSERSYRLRPILSSSKGILLLKQLSRTYTKYTFVNNSETPDLWAVVYGWDTKNLAAAINVVPITTLNASIASITFDRITDLGARLHSYATTDLPASISGIGGFNSITAYINISGHSSIISASIYPYFSVSGIMSIPVSTIPFSDLRATVNYPVGDHVFGSGFKALSAFANCLDRGTLDISAQISATTDTLSLSGTLTGLKSTRLRVLNITFVSRIRSFSSIRAGIAGVGHGVLNLGASITPDHYSTDLLASITVKRYVFRNIQKLSPISVYKIVKNNATLLKELELKFGSAVPYYIYDSLSSTIYSFGDERWTIRMSSTTTAEDFFDKTSESIVDIDNISIYNSVDEAIRAAIDRMSLGYYSVLGASIASRGGYYPLTSTIYVTQADRESYLQAEIVGVP